MLNHCWNVVGVICSYILGSHPKSSLQFLEGVLHSKLYMYKYYQVQYIKYQEQQKTPPFRQIGCNQKDPSFASFGA